MNGKDIGAGGGKLRNVTVGVFDHQMHVEGEVRHLAQGGNHRWADGDVGHEMTIHDIDMQIIGAAGCKGAYFLAETGEVGGEDGRGYFNHGESCRGWRSFGSGRNTMSAAASSMHFSRPAR